MFKSKILLNNKPYKATIILSVNSLLCLYSAEFSIAPINVKATYPQVVSGEIGVIMGGCGLGSASSTGSCFGPFISIEPGLRGGKAHIGFMSTEFASFAGAWGIRPHLTYMYSYNMVDSIDDNKNYLGFGLTANAFIFVPTIQFLRRFEKLDDNSILISAGIGIGL